MAGAGVDGGEAIDLGIAGFRIVRTIGRDALGIRYAVEDEAARLPGTLRVVPATGSAGQLSALHCFWESLARQPPHPALPAVVAHGMTADGRPWVVTSEVELESLDERLRSPPALGTEEVVRIAVAVVEALQVLHAHDLVHGGVNPAAVVRCGSAWRLTDPGIAQILLPLPPPDLDSPVDQASAHAAPEVLAGADVTPAGDVYALGATIAAASTGRPLLPWRPDEAVGALLDRHRSLQLPTVEPPALAQVVELACRRDPEQRPTADQLAALVASRLAERGPEAQDLGAQVLDDDVQFTVYRPVTVPPGRWSTMLAFAHKTDPGDPDLGPADPVEEVRRQARAVLGDDLDRYATAAEDSASVLARGSELTFVPQMEGVEFNPPSSSFRWLEAVHREDFRLRAARSLAGRRARGRLSVFMGNLLVADVNLTIRVTDEVPSDASPSRLEPERARPYRRIFASYSHRDAAIVTHMGMLAEVLGDEFVRDCTHLRSGEVWSEQLEELVRSADVFQLFWSTNAMASPYVRREWEYALSLGRESFVRPCYWEDPLPARPAEDLPPSALQRLHFQRLPFSPPADRVPPPFAVPDAEAAAGARQEAENARRYAAERARQEAEEAEREAFRKRQEAAAALFEQPLAPGQTPTGAPSTQVQLPGAAEAKRYAPRPAAQQAPPKPGDLVCDSCGGGNDPARRFCRRCGASVAAAVVAPEPPWWQGFRLRLMSLALLRHAGGSTSSAEEAPWRRTPRRIFRYICVLAFLLAVAAVLAYSIARLG